jgi:hypothetical protein
LNAKVSLDVPYSSNCKKEQCLIISFLLANKKRDKRTTGAANLRASIESFLFMN